MGIVKLTTTPPGATLYLDGAKLELASPATLDRIEAKKEHVLLVQLAGYKDALERFTLAPAEVRPLQVRLQHEHHHGGAHAAAGSTEPGAAPAPEPPVKLEGEGTLLVASSPWCNVSVDGQDKGPTPVSIKLPAGRHTVLLSNPEFKINRTMPVLILPNETLRKKLDFN
jgi:hypothetical protein